MNENAEWIVKNLRRIAADNHRCFGCGQEHNCSIHGCAIIKEAAAWIERRAEQMEELRQALADSEAARTDLGKRVAALGADNARLAESYDTMANDLLTRTKQLRTCQEQLEAAKKERNNAADRAVVLEHRLDAVLADCKRAFIEEPCEYCGNYREPELYYPADLDCEKCEHADCPCRSCQDYDKWIWRGTGGMNG